MGSNPIAVVTLFFFFKRLKVLQQFCAFKCQCDTHYMLRFEVLRGSEVMHDYETSI